MTATNRPTKFDRSSILALGFGTTVAMWAVGYVGRLPTVLAPSPLVLVLMLACLVGGGYLTGRIAGGGAREGAIVGALASVLNLLVLGSLLSGGTPGSIVPSALAWIPGSLAAGIALAAAGAALGRVVGVPRPEPTNWTAAFAKVAAAATFLLLVVGGLVTSAEAGLSVVDWPRSYGYNMFLYPLSRMTGGIYYEHAHRLVGSLVGLTTVVLALHLFRVETRRRVKGLAAAAVVLVIAQGILGGLRVTGRFTLATDTQATEPNIYLAVLHGVLGQVFFATMVALAVFTSSRWTSKHRASTASVPGDSDRAFAWVFVGLLLVQLVLGATLRHLDAALYVHAGLGTLLLPVAALLGTRGLGVSHALRPLRSFAILVIALAGTQVVLGLAALAVTRMLDRGPVPGPWSLTLATAHQGIGAALLGAAVALALWMQRSRAAGQLSFPSSTPSEDMSDARAAPICRSARS